MTIRVVIVAMLGIALGLGALMYYLQVYAYYEEQSLEQAGGLHVVMSRTGELEELPVTRFRAIDSDSSPIRFRACFETEVSRLDLAGAVMVEDAEPLVAPGWFDCFDAEAIGAELASGGAVAVLGQENVHYGIDRVLAITQDGRGYAWHQINSCGEVVFDGNPAPEGCPPAP